MRGQLVLPMVSYLSFWQLYEVASPFPTVAVAFQTSP